MDLATLVALTCGRSVKTFRFSPPSMKRLLVASRPTDLSG